MADVKWIKIVTDVFDDEKILMIESMPDADSIIVIWFKLLCLAGKQNNCGVFLMGHMPYTDEMFSTVFRRPINTVRLALKTFEQFGMVEIINNTVTIPNWDKHQSLDSYEKKKERDRLYQAERRASQKAIAEKSSDKSSDIAISDKIRIDKIRKEKEEDKEHKASPLDILEPDVKDAMLSFMEMRKRIKKPMSDNAIQRMINKLNNLSFNPEEQVKILNQSEDACWLDIYPLKTEKKKAHEDGDNIFLNIAKEEGII